MQTTTLDDVKLTLANATRGVLFTSENEAPFKPIVLSPDASPERPIDVNDLRRRFAIADNVPVTERSLEEFFRYGTEPDPADAAAAATSAKVRALRDALRSMVSDITAFRVGIGPEVRYFIVGHFRLTGAPGDGAIVGVETIGYES